MAGREAVWLDLSGPDRSRFWTWTLIHLFIAGTRVKIRSHLTVTDLALLVAQGAQNAGPSPLPPVQAGDAVEVERVVSKDGNIALAGKVVLAAEILGGRRVGIRIEAATLMIYDLDSRAAPHPAQPAHSRAGPPARGNRPASPPRGRRSSRSGCSAAPRTPA